MSLVELAAKIKAAVSLPDVVSRTEKLEKKGDEYKGLCPFHSERTPSFAVKAEFYHCFGCGAHGDAIDFVQHRHGMDFRQAVEALADEYGIERPRRPVFAKPVKLATAKLAQPRATPADQLKKIRAVYEQALPWQGTPVETYLRRRIPAFDEINPAFLTSLRFASLTYYHKSQSAERYEALRRNVPVMIAALCDRHGDIQGCHLTYLEPTGATKLKLEDPDAPGKMLPAKKMRGVAWGSAIRLGTGGRTYGIAEGIENGLTFMSAFPDIPVWVAGSVDNMAGKGVGKGLPHPFPKREGMLLPSVYPDHAHPGIEIPLDTKRLFLICDSDAGDQLVNAALMERAINRWRQLGIDVRAIMPPAGKDLNDVALEFYDEWGTIEPSVYAALPPRDDVATAMRQRLKGLRR